MEHVGKEQKEMPKIYESHRTWSKDQMVKLFRTEK
jgi:hypothetical protein